MVYKMGFFERRVMAGKSYEGVRIFVTTFMGIVFGFLIGISFTTKLNFLSSFPFQTDDKNAIQFSQMLCNTSFAAKGSLNTSTEPQKLNITSKIWVPSNPRGSERLPPDIVVAESDFYLRRLWGKPSEDLNTTQKYLVTFTVGYDQRKNVDAAVKKFSSNFTILLFHYDGRTTEWNEYEWSKRAIHVSAPKQTKWWYAKRFLHPDIVAAYDYIFIWDEDLGVENFNAEEYIKLIQKHGLEISQPGLDPSRGLTWNMTGRRPGVEVHKELEEKPEWCRPYSPPCASFVEIMAPVFSRTAWRCVWNLIQNDLVHGWGLDFAVQRCVEPAHEKIGVVDAQWIVHQSVPSLGSQGQAEAGKAPWQGVRERCKEEWKIFESRVQNAEQAYYQSLGIHLPNSTTSVLSIIGNSPSKFNDSR